MNITRKIAGILREKIYHKLVFGVSIIFFILTLIFTSLQYLNIYPGNYLSWVGWIIAVITFSYSFIPRRTSTKLIFGQFKRTEFMIATFVIILYFVTHLWNFEVAPWNSNGLFDDAAWDIYFAKTYAFKSPFQAAYFDNVGYISREVVFHYYITLFFKIFGYNLLVFNISLLILGFVTVFFTTFIIHKLFRNTIVTLVSAVVINFFPLHYTHIFMGHRYAITAPLMVVSLYFLYTAFLNKSFLKATLSAFFAALCFGSAIMGKQYISGLIISAFLTAVFGKRKWLSKENITLGVVWIIAFIISATPLLTYIIFNSDLYFLREKGLSKEFVALVLSGDMKTLEPYFSQLAELFLAKQTYKRQFLPDFYIIPLSYYLLLVPGLFLALLKRRFEIFLLSIIAVIGALVSGSYDFRVLLSVPIWVIAMAYVLNLLFSHKITKSLNIQLGLKLVILLVLLAGLIPSITYLWRVSEDTNHFYLLPHKDVAFSRLVQDIVVGSGYPTSSMKKNEFNRKVDVQKVRYDTLVCPFSSYAIAHLYLQDFNDKKILLFCNQGIQLLKTSGEILNDNIRALSFYKTADNDLKLVWEISDKSKPVIEIFSKFKIYGNEEIITDGVDGVKFSVYILTIENENIESFKKDIISAL